MNITSILQELRAESERLERAITAILGISSDGATRRTATKRTRPRLSASARKRLSLLMKRRWASGKMKGRAKARPNVKKAAQRSAAKKAKTSSRISAAGRKRLSQMMKKRWA